MFKNKWAVILTAAIVAAVLFLAGLAVGMWARRDAGSTRSLPSEEELSALKAQIDEDEAGYTSYAAFEQSAMYRKAPDRIWFKPANEDNFYLFDPRDEEFEHLLEVIEDRMHYSSIEDYDLACFSPDSVETMMTSGHRYVVLDYNNVGLSSIDEDYEYNLVFNFGENTRLYRLIRYLSYFKEPVMPAEDFTSFAGASGYEYMQQRRLTPEYPKEENGVYWQSKQLGYKETTSVESLAITTDGGASYREAITKEQAIQRALKEAQKEKYKYQGPDCRFTEGGTCGGADLDRRLCSQLVEGGMGRRGLAGAPLPLVGADLG